MSKLNKKSEREKYSLKVNIEEINIMLSNKVNELFESDLSQYTIHVFKIDMNPVRMTKQALVEKIEELKEEQQDMAQRMIDLFIHIYSSEKTGGWWGALLEEAEDYLKKTNPIITLNESQIEEREYLIYENQHSLVMDFLKGLNFDETMKYLSSKL